MSDNPLSPDLSGSDQPAPNTLPEMDVSPQNTFTNEQNAALGQAVDQMTAVIQQLQADFQAKIQYDQSKDRVIDALHRELQDYREDLAFKILSPLINDVVQLYNDVDAVTAREVGDASGDRVRLQTHDFLSDIESILQRYGFDLYQSDETIFDRKLHRAAGVEATFDRTLDLTIIQRLRRGVRYGERIIRPESVVVYQYKVPADTPPTE